MLLVPSCLTWRPIPKRTGISFRRTARWLPHLEEKLEQEYRRFSSEDAEDQAPELEEIDQERIERLRSLGYVGFSAAGTRRPAIDGLPDPKDKIDVYSLLMEAFHDSEQGRFRESTRKLREVLRQDDGLVDAHLYLGLNLVEAADYQNASSSFKKVLELDQRNVLATFNLALCYANLGKLEAAFEGLRRTLELDPEDTPARVALGLRRTLELVYRVALGRFKGKRIRQSRCSREPSVGILILRKHTFS